MEVWVVVNPEPQSLRAGQAVVWQWPDDSGRWLARRQTDFPSRKIGVGMTVVGLESHLKDLSGDGIQTLFCRPADKEFITTILRRKGILTE